MTILGDLSIRVQDFLKKRSCDGCNMGDFRYSLLKGIYCLITAVCFKPNCKIAG